MNLSIFHKHHGGVCYGNCLTNRKWEMVTTGALGSIRYFLWTDRTFPDAEWVTLRRLCNVIYTNAKIKYLQTLYLILIVNPLVFKRGSTILTT